MVTRFTVQGYATHLEELRARRVISAYPKYGKRYWGCYRFETGTRIPWCRQQAVTQCTEQDHAAGATRTLGDLSVSYSGASCWSGLGLLPLWDRDANP